MYQPGRERKLNLIWVKLSLSHEGAAYVNDDWDISEKFSISAGLRYTYFNQVGPFDRYVQNELLQNY